jgi:succinate dehydrogenase / fumarate reductase cytochrome b subunit
MGKPKTFKLPVSSIVNKLVMSITGAFLVLFLTFHAAMNITAVFSAEGYNMICELLGANWYALVATVILAGGVVVHVLYACYLTLLNYIARGSKRYAVEKAPAGVSWSSRNMLVLGAFVLIGLLLHLYNFWFNMQWVELTMTHEQIAALPIGPTDGAGHIAALFSCPVYVVVYLLWFVAIWFHLTHGVWSMFQSAGWGNKKWYPRLKCIANIYATLLMLMFAAVAIVFYLRSLCGGGASCGF